MEQRVIVLENPRQLGKPLKDQLGAFWRYRIGDCRVICDIQDQSLGILVIKLGNCKDIYPL